MAAEVTAVAAERLIRLRMPEASAAHTPVEAEGAVEVAGATAGTASLHKRLFD